LPWPCVVSWLRGIKGFATRTGIARPIAEGFMASKAGSKAVKSSKGEEITIVLQVGTTFRVNNKGDVILDNPELELADDQGAADATLLYSFDPATGEHSFTLVDPVADRAHMKVHRPND
jgi:hypothetical protein